MKRFHVSVILPVINKQTVYERFILEKDIHQNKDTPAPANNLAFVWTQ